LEWIWLIITKSTPNDEEPITFFLVIALIPFIGTEISELIVINKRVLGLVIGATLCFFIGFLDDCIGVHAIIKLGLQILAASIAFYCGLSFSKFTLFELSFPLLSLPFINYILTVFWFTLFLNAINLIDGLDGLAGGICLFTCLVMVMLLVLQNDLQLAIYFTILSGSIAPCVRVVVAST
jgi:UDP-GlcNAc:undecaprenyl-phosphate GlcNAc-1-phosphate transferase